MVFLSMFRLDVQTFRRLTWDPGIVDFSRVIFRSDGFRLVSAHFHLDFSNFHLGRLRPLDSRQFRKPSTVRLV